MDDQNKKKNKLLMLLKVYPLEEVFYFSKKLLYKYLFVCVFNCSVMSDSLQPYGL